MGGYHRRDGATPVRFVDAINLGCDLQSQTRAHGNVDGAIRPFFGRDAAQDSKVIAARMQG
ncbi:hypothetical protein, partial [Klebsiella pneumoniae]|uniref:hypothetical protein n=1 Tax=Klebsiella pneumoniae TaxID=573 RepID=UPI0021571F06